MSDKGKLAIYWAAACGGCEISVLSVNEKILDVLGAFDLVFCPCIMDPKREDVEAMADGEIDVCLFNGSIRNSEQEEMAHLMRRKSKVLVAYGACAQQGGIPGLANLHDRESIFETVYVDAPSNDNAARVFPRPSSVEGGNVLTLPEFWDGVQTLAQTVKVDYYLPGCPPEADRILDAVTAIIAGELPPAGSVIGSNTTVCAECPRTRDQKKVTRFLRTWEMVPDPDTCLLEQGLICCGIATRAGCEARCPGVNSPCIGCYGPAEGAGDIGARMISALASVIDSDDPAEVRRIIEEGIPDPVGTFYRFSLPNSLLGRSTTTSE